MTKIGSGIDTALNEPFDVVETISDAVGIYRTEALRRGVQFTISATGLPHMVVGNARRIQTIVGNITANAGQWLALSLHGDKF